MTEVPGFVRKAHPTCLIRTITNRGTSQENVRMSSDIPSDAELDRIVKQMKGEKDLLKREDLRRKLAERYCDQDAYRLLKQCSAAQNMDAWKVAVGRSIPEKNCLQGADLSGACYRRADFTYAHCEGAKFLSAHCKKASFIEADCEDASFLRAKCKGASFREANSEGANFVGAECEGTSFFCADFDGKSDFSGCFIDNETDFRLTNLGAIKIEPGKRAMLERNIRRLNWEEWYQQLEQPKYRQACRLTRRFWLPQHGLKDGRKKVRAALLGMLTPKAQMVRLFWWISDYGYSTGRILGIFVLGVIAFALVYTIWPGMLSIGAEGKPLPAYSGFGGFIGHFCKMFCFAAATMMTLGFGNINVAATAGEMPNLPGMLVVALNLATGYFLLAVLVTRLAVLFQTMAPGHQVSKKARSRRQ